MVRHTTQEVAERMAALIVGCLKGRVDVLEFIQAFAQATEKRINQKHSVTLIIGRDQDRQELISQDLKQLMKEVKSKTGKRYTLDKTKNVILYATESNFLELYE